jgi:hypothetical protein
MHSIFLLDYDAIVIEAQQSGCHSDRLLARKTGYILKFEFFYAPNPILLQPDFPMIQINGFIEYLPFAYSLKLTVD